MVKRGRVKVIKESPSGLNELFKDQLTGQTMTRREFVDKIEQGKYPDYHVRKINGRYVPCSNPDHSESNNLD